MKAFSVDLRERIVAACERGMSRTEVARTFDVSSGTIKRLLAKHRRGQDLQPGSPPGPSSTIPDNDPDLLAQLHAHPDATYLEHAQLWNAAHATTLSQWALGRAIRRLGWTRKKSRSSPVNETSSSEQSSESGLPKETMTTS